MKSNNPRYQTSREIPFQDFFPLRSDKKCRYCEKPLTGKQTSWCSKICQDTAYTEVMIARGHPASIRIALLDRDDGICALCGADCKQVERISRHAYRSIIVDAVENAPLRNYSVFYEYGKDPATVYEKDYYKFARKLFKDSLLNFGSSCWHADHIIEVAAGGKNELENFQTLCVFCHKKKTRNFVKKEGVISRKKSAKKSDQNMHEKDAVFCLVND